MFEAIIMKTFTKSTWSILGVSLLITVFIVLLGFVFSGFDTNELFDLKSLGITFLYVFTLTLVNSLFYEFTDKKLDWSTQAKKRLIIGIVGSIVITMLAYFCCRLLQLVVIEQKFSVSEFLEQEKAGNYFFTFLLVVIISLFIHVFYFFKVIQENKVKEQKIIAGTASAKFDALKNQLDPHFLFNSLNVLTSLIDENPESAQKFTTSLSKVYRYVLEQKSKELVSVEEELDFAKVYIGLLKMRFENSIRFEIPNSITNPEAKIVSLSLQLLLENAVKHNRISEENPLVIRIYEDDGNLTVTNNLQPKKTLNKSSGIGLSNIQMRYGLLTSRKVTLHKNEKAFTVCLPMLTKKIAIVQEPKSKTMENIEYQKMKRAKEKVDKIKGFYGNLTSYVIIVPFLAFVNYFSNGFDFPWFLFPMIGWGIGVLFHYMDTFGHNLFLGKNWEERKIKEFMDKNH